MRLVAAFEPDHYDILGQRVGKQVGIEKCQSVKLSEKKKKKDVRNNMLLFLPEDDSVHDTIQKSFYTPEIYKGLSDGMTATDISLWSEYSELHHSISCFRS